MNSEDEEQLTALGLALDFSNQFNQRTLDDGGPSAGANAGSCACMTFVAANPLSEIVWSPHRGLCLRCAECSFPDRKHLLSRGVDSKNVLPLVPQSTSQNANCSLQDDKNNLVGLEQSLKVKVDGIRSSTLNFPMTRTGAVRLCLSGNDNHTGNGGSMLDMNTDADISSLHRSPEVENVKHDEAKDDSGIHNRRTGVTLEATEPKSPLPGQTSERSVGSPKNELSPVGTNAKCKNVASSNEGMGLQIIPCTEASPINGDKVSHNPRFSPRSGSIRPASSMNEAAVEKDKNCNYGLPLVEKLESMDENDVQTGKIENAGNIASGSSPVGNGGIIIKVAEIEAKETQVPDDNSPTVARIRKCLSKGKEKALSDSDINGRTLEDDDDSHESVESCNSMGLLSVGKKRLKFEQQLIVRSKRAKQIQENPNSSSYSKQDSSFLNWISNMMKGFTRQNQDKSCSLALALANPDARHEHLDPTLDRCNKNIDYLCGEMGFKSIFQSIYCPRKNDQDAKGSFPSNRAREGSVEKEVANRCDINVDTIMYSEGINATNKMLESTKVFGEFHLGNEAGSHTLPQSPYANMSSSQDAHKMHSLGSMNSNILEGGRNQGLVNISNPSLAVHELYKVENNSASPLEDSVNHLTYRGDPLRSLWIARFSSKSSSPLLKQDALNTGRHGDVKGPNNCMKASYTQHSSGLHKDQVTSEVKYHLDEPSCVLVHEMQNYVISNEAASFGLKRLEVSHDSGIIQTASHTLSSQRLKSSEAMASVFARRLDALRNILPSDQAADAIRARTSCFFCGMKGHCLRNCSKILETEMEELLKKVNSHDSWEETPRLCIRCLQLNHWAIACPNIPPKLHQLDDHAPTSRPSNPMKNFTMGSARKEVSTSENMFSRTNLIEKDKKLMLGSQTDENPHSKNQTDENEIRDLSISSKGKNWDVPKGIFEAIKLLRLSRTDIFKWMNSQISLSQLDGFFLRLRLGKWEGLAGTGYCVACINGMQREKQVKDARSPISVNVGGIKCVVESQYISNHDFVEDELMAWWSTTSQGGGKIPSEEELKSKVEERKMLGF